MSIKRLMVDLTGTVLTEEEREILCHPIVGGVILFTRNFESLEQLTQLVKHIRQCTGEDFLIAVDHEGGRVQRFRKDFTQLPAPSCLGRLYNENPQQAQQVAKQHGWLMAAELKSVDIDFSFAPVLDLDYGISGVIGDRAFHENPSVVSELAAFYMQGMKEAGMAATGKHFPGHGAVLEDSHLAIPVDYRSKEVIFEQDIQPFIKMIAQGLDAIMPAHITFTSIDTQPAGFSEVWLKKILRQELHFNGLIFSDDLTMEGAAVAGGYLERAEAAIAAGCDVIMACNNRVGLLEILDNLTLEADAAVMERMKRMKGQPFDSSVVASKKEQWSQAVAAIKILDKAVA